MVWSDPARKWGAAANGSRRTLVRGGLGTEGHGEEDSEGPRLADASLLLGFMLCPQNPREMETGGVEKGTFLV